MMMNEVRARNQERKNSARITAGFCCKWSNPQPDGNLVNDVVVGNFQMPWERKDAFWRWATDDSGMEQVGTVYTAQGFEYDYMAVIFGNDLVYDASARAWKAVPECSHDTQVKRNNWSTCPTSTGCCFPALTRAFMCILWTRTQRPISESNWRAR